MGALAEPQKLALTRMNAHLASRIGVRVDGHDMGERVISYDVREGWARLTDESVRYGKIEPYWR